MLNPLRNDKEEQERLIQKLQDEEHARRLEIADQQKQLLLKLQAQRQRRQQILEKSFRESISSPTKDQPDSSEDELRRKFEERLEKAKTRRASLLQNELIQRTLEIQRNDLKTQMHTENQAEHQISEVRAKKWLTILAAFTGLSAFKNKLAEEIVNEKHNLLKWHTAITIQRFWRQITAKISGNPVEKKLALSNKIRRSSMFIEGNALFKRRQHAAGIIISVLKETVYQSIISRYLGKVRRIQRRVRSRNQITSGRLFLLNMLMEICLYPLAAHINVVVSGRGLDLKNLTAFESGQLKMYANLARMYRVIQEMNTAGFHSIIRLNTNKLQDFHKDFVASSKMWSENGNLRRRLLRVILTEKRKKFLEKLHRIEPIQLKIAKISTDEVKRFIKGGQDPLHSRVIEMSDKYDQWYQEQFRPKTPFRCRDPAKKADFEVPVLLLISSFSPIDILDFYIRFIDAVKASQAKGSSTGAQSGGVNSNRKTRDAVVPSYSKGVITTANVSHMNSSHGLSSFSNNFSGFSSNHSGQDFSAGNFSAQFNELMGSDQKNKSSAHKSSSSGHGHTLQRQLSSSGAHGKSVHSGSYRSKNASTDAKSPKTAGKRGLSRNNQSSSNLNSSSKSQASAVSHSIHHISPVKSPTAPTGSKSSRGNPNNHRVIK